MNDNKLAISNWQLFSLIVLFELGSAIVMNIGQEAKRDSWIAILAATVIGIGIFTFYRYLQSRRPGFDLFEIARYAFGPIAGSGVIFLYILYFLYLGARVLRDFIEIISTAVLATTPIEVIVFTFTTVIAYMLWHGAGAFIRTAELFFLMILIVFLLLIVLMIWDHEYHFAYLQPVLGDGVKPVLSAVFPALITFPFGELIVLVMFLKFTSAGGKVGTVSSWAIGTAGLILTCTTILETVTLDVKPKLRSLFPFLVTVRDISFAYLFERLEMLVIFMMFVTILIKVSAYLFGALKGIEHLFRIPYRTGAFPISCIIALLSIYVADSFAEHAAEGLKIVPLYIHIPMQFVIPFLMLLAVMVKAAKEGKEGEAK
ncbi:spore germination protein [Paenibacillus curdlanolyticus YK9]|uniref:Spore germination protein n=1 Tax=Paenibacillus curdlanolyticus YK9 TaxID=717606 RepID=E0I7Q5_9BACL|nr:GerAB/ArcD/ProY family transporter [Paenibacillus curdlanolyticus]EFM11210.1 spore germination protein [Paenibacillus curdlanolyticus YK9]